MQKNQKMITAPEAQNSGTFTMQVGNTTFLVGLHFSGTSKETLEDKMKKLIERDVKTGNF